MSLCGVLLAGVALECIERLFGVVVVHPMENYTQVKGAPPVPVDLRRLHDKGATVHGRSGGEP